MDIPVSVPVHGYFGIPVKARVSAPTGTGTRCREPSQSRRGLGVSPDLELRLATPAQPPIDAPTRGSTARSRYSRQAVLRLSSRDARA